MPQHYGDYPTPEQTGISYTKTIPKVWGWDTSWVNEYPSSSTWKQSWCSDYFYNQAARGKPVGTAPDFSYNDPPEWASQNIMTVDHISPLWEAAGAYALYKLVYR